MKPAPPIIQRQQIPQQGYTHREFALGHANRFADLLNRSTHLGLGVPAWYESKPGTEQGRKVLDQAVPGSEFLAGQTPAGQPQTKAADQVKAQPKPAETKPAVPLPLIALVEANIKTMDGRWRVRRHHFD